MGGPKSRGAISLRFIAPELAFNGYALALIYAVWPCVPRKGGLKLRRARWLLRLELPSNPEILSVVRSAMMRLTAELGFPARECRALTRAVDEALANIICHAYGGRTGTADRAVVLSAYKLEPAANSERASRSCS